MSSTPVARVNPVLVIVVLGFGGLCAALTQTMVIPIQPILPELLDTSLANSGWVITITLLVGAVAMPVAGSLADMFGKKPVLIGCAAALAVGSALCAVGDTLLPMLLGRGLQGVAAGFIPVGISLVREVSPPKLAGTAVAAMSATLGVGGAIGLPLSAWTVQAGDWHLLFWISTVLALLVVAATVTAVPRGRPAPGGRVDWIGAIGLAVGLVFFLLGVSKASNWGWGDSRTIGAMLVGVLVLVLWGRYELGHRAPLVDLRASARRPVLMTNLAAVAIGFGMMAQSIVLPQLLQLPESTGYGMGQTLLQAGLWMAPAGLMMLVFSPVSSQLMATTGPRNTLAVAAVVLAGGYAVAFVLMDAPWQLMLASVVASAGVGIGYAAMPTMVMDNVDQSEAGSAVGLNALMRSVGTTSASAVMATVMAGSTIDLAGHAVPDEAAFQWCFAIGVGAALVGAMLTLLIPRQRPGLDVGEPERVAAGA